MNALCWHRDLVGDFKEIVAKLELKENITEVSIEDLLTLKLSEEGNLAREIILNDIQLLTNFGASPTLNLLKITNEMKSWTLFQQMYIHFILIAHRLKQILSSALITALQVISYPMIRWSKRF